MTYTVVDSSSNKHCLHFFHELKKKNEQIFYCHKMLDARIQLVINRQRRNGNKQKENKLIIKAMIFDLI